MKLTKELLEKAKGAASAEELLKLAEAENIKMTAEEAGKAFADLHKAGEVSDDELDNVAGGACDDPTCSNDTGTPEGVAKSAEAVVYLFAIGQRVIYYDPYGHAMDAIVIKRHVTGCNEYYYPVYNVTDLDGNNERVAHQNNLATYVGF